MKHLAASLGAKHRFSTAYAPWANGTVESVCKEVLRVMRAFNTEMKKAEVDWPTSVSAIQSIINNSPSRRLGNRAPITVHTGMESGNPLSLALSEVKIRKTRSMDEARILQELNITAAQEALDNIHKEVEGSLSASRKQAVERHNSKTHITPYKPFVGDYVVVARFLGPHTKMSTQWVGPRRITQILSDFTVEVEHLLQGSKKIFHVCRIRPYADSLVGTPVQMKDVAEHTDQILYSVENIKDIRETSNVFKVLVSWKGYTSAADSWEPLKIMYEDVPRKVRNFFKTRKNDKVVKRACLSLGI